MKKNVFMVLALLAMAVPSVMAADIGLNAGAIQDFSVDQTGARVEMTVGGVSPFITPKLNVTMMEDVYNRYDVGGDFSVYKYKALAFDAVLVGVYQQTIADNGFGSDDNGFGATAGLKATLMFNDTVGINTGYEYFVGEKALEDYEGGVATVGLVAKF